MQGRQSQLWFDSLVWQSFVDAFAAESLPSDCGRHLTSHRNLRVQDHCDIVGVNVIVHTYVMCNLFVLSHAVHVVLLITVLLLFMCYTNVLVSLIELFIH